MQKIVLDFVAGWNLLSQNEYLINNEQKAEITRQLFQRMSGDLLEIMRWVSNNGVNFSLLYPNPVLNVVDSQKVELAINDTFQLLALMCHTQLTEAGLFYPQQPVNNTSLYTDDFPYGLENVTPSFLLLVHDSGIHH